MSTVCVYRFVQVYVCFWLCPTAVTVLHVYWYVCEDGVHGVGVYADSNQYRRRSRCWWPLLPIKLHVHQLTVVFLEQTSTSSSSCCSSFQFFHLFFLYFLHFLPFFLYVCVCFVFCRCITACCCSLRAKVFHYPWMANLPRISAPSAQRPAPAASGMRIVIANGCPLATRLAPATANAPQGARRIYF